MSTKRILYTRADDGGLSIVVPSPSAIRSHADEESLIATLIRKSVPSDALNVRVIEDAEVPLDREFRNAWTHTAGQFGIDMAKARAIQAERVAEALERANTTLAARGREATLKGRTAEASSLNAKRAQIDNLDLSAVADAINAAVNVDELRAAFPGALVE